MVQIRKTALNEGADEIDREARALIGAEQQGRIRHTLRCGESRPVDHVAPVSRQRQPVPGFRIGRARLGILSGETPQANDPLLAPLHQHKAHLEQDLQLARDGIRIAVGKTLRAIPPLQKKPLPTHRLSELGLQIVDFPARDQRRQRTQFSDGPIQRHLIRIRRLLRGCVPLPGVRCPVPQTTNFLRCLTHFIRVQSS